MKNKLVNKNVIRAISVGLAAVMASTPITAFAAEGENPTEGNDTEQSGQQSVTEPSAETKANEEVTDQLDEVKDDYKEEAAELGAAGDTDESGVYATVAGEISDIEGGIDAVNKANDAAETEKEAYEKELAEANAALQEVDKAVSELETTDEDGNTVTIWEQAQDAAEVTGELAQDAADAADKAENAATRDEVNQAATDAQTAADAADAVSDELTEELATVDAELADAQEAVKEAETAYNTAQAAADTAQDALDQLLLDNDLATQNEDGTLTILTDKVDAKDANGEYIVSGDVREAIAAAQKTLDAAKEDAENAKTQMDTATKDMNETEVSLLKQIVELQDKIVARKNYNDETYWNYTKTMNEYLIRYQLLQEVEGLQYNTIDFGNWKVDKTKVTDNTTASDYVVNPNYVEVTYTVQADDGTTKTETKRFNYRKANNTTNIANKGTSDIEVYEKILETITDEEAYSADENANGDVLTQTTKDDGTTTYQITTKNADGTTSTTEVSGVVVEVTTTAEDGTTKSEKLVSGEELSTETKVTAGETEAGNGTVKTDNTLTNSKTTYAYEMVTIVDETKESVSTESLSKGTKTEMKKAVMAAFEEAENAGDQLEITVTGTTWLGGKYSCSYTSLADFLADFTNIPDHTSGDALGNYDITATTTKTTATKTHTEYRVTEKTTADVTSKTTITYTDDNYETKLACEAAAKAEKAELAGKYDDVSYTVEVAETGLFGIPTKYKYTITYSKTTTTAGATVSTTTYAVSDTFTSTDHAAVTHTEWTSGENTIAYVTQAGVLNANKAYTDAKKAQAEATKKQTKANNLYQQLLDALENLKTLQKAKDVSSADLAAAQAEVTELQDAYDDAKEAADKAEENAEQAQEAADRAAEAAANFVEPSDDGATDPAADATTDDGATVPAADAATDDTTDPAADATTDDSATVPAADATTDDGADDTTDADDNDVDDADDISDVTPAVVNIVDATAPLAAAPAAANVQLVNAPAAQDVVNIADDTTPLADTADTNAAEQTTGDQKQASITITDEETPLVAIADEDQEKMSWWWLLIVAVLGATGYELYKKHQQKKAEQAQQQNIEQ